MPLRASRCSLNRYEFNKKDWAGRMKNTLAEQLILYQSNVLPPLLEKLSEQLHVSVAALTSLEIGYSLRNNCWVFPERDEFGMVIGLSLRQWDGKKYMFKGSKRGLIYVPYIHATPTDKERYHAGPHNWTRTTEAVPCPICGKPDWCLVSSEEPTDPKAVLCCRVGEGASRDLGTAGYLHILKTDGELTQAGSVLMPSEHSVLIVEGATDVAAALDIDLIAIGRPSSTGCLDKLTQMVAGRGVIVLGENDAGAGREGMEKAFDILQPHARTIVKMLPPEGVKDLRQWVHHGLTQKQLLDLTKIKGDTTSTDSVLESVAPLDLAKLWLDATHHQNDIYTLRIFHGTWYVFDGLCYRELGRDSLRQQLYRYFGGKQYKKIHAKGFDILNYDPSKQKMDGITDALLAFCPIAGGGVPCWLVKGHEASDPKQILTFSNGYLDLSSEHPSELCNLTPHFFSLASYPFDFDPTATCGIWNEFLLSIFKDDPLKISLLQEWFGYNLIPDNSQEKFMMMIGPSRAGKGTILDTLSSLLGQDQVVATSLRDFTRRFALYSFFGKLAAVIGDVSVGREYDSVGALNLLKRITGNDGITIERKGMDVTQAFVQLYTRFTMAANVMPQLPDKSRTLESRMLLLIFPISFAGREDTTLKVRLRDEAPGILIWALAGLKRLRENGDFTKPTGHRKAMSKIRGELSPMVEFVGDHCILGSGTDHYVVYQHLYECWKQWAILTGEKVRTARAINSEITTLYPSCTRSRKLINGTRRQIIKGIKLTPEAAIRLGMSE